MFWTEPVVRTLYLGQVNLVLMALILWDLCQPDTRASRWWKGAGVGIAAGIKLVPLVFIPYLLFARKFRQAAMASAAFVFTVLLGFVIQGPDSSKWWFGGLFFQGGRTGFTGWEGNQSLRGLLTRLAGSISGAQTSWILAAVLIGSRASPVRRSWTGPGTRSRGCSPRRSPACCSRRSAGTITGSGPRPPWR